MIDIKSVIKVITIILAILDIFFILPIIVGIYYHETIFRFLLYELFLIILTVSILYKLREHKIALKIKGAIVVTNLTWIMLGVIGAIPYMLYTSVDFSSGFFEAISGFTTTGATVFSNIEIIPRMVLFFRSMTHWLGGMGIIILGVGLLSFINPTGSITLFKAESTGITMDKFAPKIKDTALMLWGIYIFLTIIDTICLHQFGMDWFDAINHAFSTISTGGFSTKNDSLGHFTYSSAIIWTTTIFMVISGINFLAHLRLIRNDLSGYRSEEVKYYLIIFLVLSVVLSISHTVSSDMSITQSFTHSFFTIASIMTTTGFATVDYGTWGHFAVAIIFIAMLIGGNTGSTAGGVKVIRYIVVIKNLLSEIKRVLHPNAVVSIFIDGKNIKSSLITSVFGFFTLYIFTTIIVMVYLYARGLDEMSSISTALATVGNIGPGFVKTGPVENYGFFLWYDKIVLSFAMIIGRLECYTVFLLLSKLFWKKF